MPIPKCKIETYTGAVLDYTIENEATGHIKDILNGVGTFNFYVPTVKGLPSAGYQYTDIAVSDKAKFYFWYADRETCPANPNFVGRITKISAPIADGYYRIFEGKLHSEILQRRFQPPQYWNNVDVDSIATEIATDLTLGTGLIAVDGTHVTVYSSNDTYLDLLKKISDYWVNAGSQVKKDFYVDIGDGGHPLGHLVWNVRPLRTAGVETLTIGSTILNYTVLRDVESVKNNITAYGYEGRIGIPGHEGRCQPADKDGWTEATAGWTADYGVLSAVAFPAIGAANLSVVSELDAGTEYTKIRRDVDIETYGDAAYHTVNFYARLIFGAVTTEQVRLYAPDNANYFYTTFSALGAWTWNQFQLGQNQEYDAVTNPTAPWRKQGTPNWTLIEEICFYTDDAGSHTMYYDGLYFGHGKFRYTISNPASIGSYEQRDMQTIDDSLLSDTDCATRAETLLYQLKEAPTRIDVETDGNTNIKIGDQLTMTVPAEGISAAPYDVLTVTHDFAKDKFKTSASLVNSSLVPASINIRTLPCGAVGENIERNFEHQKQISKGLRIWK